jgi:hypothetical protein
MLSRQCRLPLCPAACCVSTNADAEIGRIIADAMDGIGKESVITEAILQ